MAAVDETIVNNGASAVFTPTNAISDVVIEPVESGKITLECLTPSSSKWVPITNETGAYGMSTSDTAVTYRFQAENVDTAVRVYMGP